MGGLARAVGRRDERAILAAGRELLACTTYREAADGALRQLEWLLGADSACLGLVRAADPDKTLNRMCGHGRITEADLEAYRRVYRHRDPVLGALLTRDDIASDRTVILERIVDMRRFQCSDLYNELLAPRGIHHVLGISVVLNDEDRLLIGIHLPESGATRFDGRHVHLANAMVPLLAATFAGALLREQVQTREAALESIGRADQRSGTAVLDAELNVLFADSAAREQLRRLHCAEGSWNFARATLPPRLLGRLRTAAMDLDVGRAPPAIDPREVGRDRGVPQLSLTTVMRAGTNARYVISFLPKGRSDDFRLRSAFGVLSVREAQLAALAARGLPNSQIGERLHLSVRTVENHLRSIYRKLELPNRTALARLIGHCELESSRAIV